MLVIWAPTKEEAQEFAQQARIGRGGFLTFGNRSARTAEGLRPSAIIEINGARHQQGADMLAVLRRATMKVSRPVPWLQLGESRVP